jgi:hypothetical protein
MIFLVPFTSLVSAGATYSAINVELPLLVTSNFTLTLLGYFEACSSKYF